MKILLRILEIVFRRKRRLLAVYLCTAGATVAQLVAPKLLGSAVDEISVVYQGGVVSEHAVFVIAVLILGVGIVRGILSYGQTYLGESLALGVVYDIRNTFYNHVQHLGFAFHDRHHTGNLMSRAITDVEAMRMFVQGGVVRTPYFLLLTIVVMVLLLRLEWRLGLLGMALMPVLAVISGYARITLGRIWRNVQEKMADLSTSLQENLTGVRVVKAFASEEFEEAKFNSKSLEVAGSMVDAARLMAVNVSFMVFALMISMALVLWYGGWMVVQGQLTWGELAQFLFYLQILATPVRHTGMIVNNFARAISAGQRLFEILDIESPVQESGRAVEMPRVRGRIRFENVSFTYGNGAEALKDVSIDAEPGQVVALLGAPGSGKSTIAHLLPRFYDVGSGRISIDDVDVRDVTLTSLRQNIGIVQQDVFLFTTTIQENIAYGRQDASLEQVVEAARVAHLDEFIQDLEEGYDTVIGERGATLSGGQRQRMSIARAVLLDPPILILDDSTSSVDASTEELIREALESVMRGRTTFVIAHRLSTVHKADQILVLKEGEIVERGTHQDLIAQGGLYRNIYDLQLRPQEEVMLEFEVRGSPGMESVR